MACKVGFLPSTGCDPRWAKRIKIGRLQIRIDKLYGRAGKAQIIAPLGSTGWRDSAARQIL